MYGSKYPHQHNANSKLFVFLVNSVNIVQFVKREWKKNGLVQNWLQGIKTKLLVSEYTPNDATLKKNTYIKLTKSLFLFLNSSIYCPSTVDKNRKLYTFLTPGKNAQAFLT